MDSRLIFRPLLLSLMMGGRSRLFQPGNGRPGPGGEASVRRQIRARVKSSRRGKRYGAEGRRVSCRENPLRRQRESVPQTNTGRQGE